MQSYNGKLTTATRRNQVPQAAAFVANLGKVNTTFWEARPGYIPARQPCDVGINKVIKLKLKKHVHNWRPQKAALLASAEVLRAPKRKTNSVAT